MSGPAIGTSYHPQADPVFNGGAGRSRPAAQLARLPRRRRPGMIALAVALVGAGVLASAALYAANNHREPVLVATADVPPGHVITSADLGMASVAVGAGVQVIPVSQLSQVVGQVAGSALHPGMLLTAAELATLRPPGPGQVLVPLPVKPSVLPAGGLSPGDRVLIVATPGTAGQSGSSATAPSMTAPVTGVVADSTLRPNADGYQVVDVIVSSGSGAAVAEQASTGQFALIVIERAP